MDEKKGVIMPIDKEYLTVGGDDYELRLDDLELEGGSVVVSIGHEKVDFRADDITVSYTVFVEGRTAATGSFVPPATFAQDRETVFAAPGDMVTVTLESQGESVTLRGRVEESFTIGDVSVSNCTVQSEKVNVGEQATVSATISNANSTGGDVDVTIEAGGTDTTETVRVPADGTATVDVTFAFDEPGEYAPSVSLSL